MNLKELFKKHYKRLVFEGVLSSALIGLIAGLFLTGTVAVLAWCFSFGNVWLAIGAGAGLAMAIGAAAYFIHYRPTEKNIARRIDSLGLEERAITMLELRDDDSMLAVKQREDTIDSVKKVEDKKIKLLLSTLVIILTSISFIFAAFATTVLGLSNAGIIPGGAELFGGSSRWVEISYEADEGGEILGDNQQLVTPGSNTTPVVAVADDGWMFLCWDDGLTTPERYESGVETNMSYMAIFVEIDKDGGDDSASGGEDDQSDALPDEIPSMEMMPPEGNEGPEQQVPESTDPSGTPNNGAGGKWNEANQFIDGNQYYRDQLDMYYELALEIFKDGGEIPPELREFFENYFDSI